MSNIYIRVFVLVFLKKELPLKTITEFVFPQVTYAEPQWCDRFDSFRITTVKNTIRRWSTNIETA